MIALFITGKCSVNEIVIHLKNIHGMMQETLTYSRNQIEFLKSQARIAEMISSIKVPVAAPVQ